MQRQKTAAHRNGGSLGELQKNFSLHSAETTEVLIDPIGNRPPSEASNFVIQVQPGDFQKAGKAREQGAFSGGAVPHQNDRPGAGRAQSFGRSSSLRRRGNAV